MFVLLAGVVLLHQVYSTLSMKIDKWPMRRFYVRLIESAGRCFVGPFILSYFSSMVQFTSSERQNAITATVIALTVVLVLRELGGLFQIFRKSIIDVATKLNTPNLEVKDVSVVEAFVINLFSFYKFSYSTKYIMEALANDQKIALRVFTAKAVFRNQKALEKLFDTSNENAESSYIPSFLRRRGATREETPNPSAVDTTQSIEMSSNISRSSHRSENFSNDSFAATNPMRELQQNDGKFNSSRSASTTSSREQQISFKQSLDKIPDVDSDDELA
jgi:hypothetical protein